jgi:DNA-binding NarL/FixJ family response regulator
VADKRDPDVVIMDMALPRMHGVDAIAAIVAARPGTRILVLSSSDDDDQVVKAVRAGATGYLLKNAGAGEIVDAIRRVHAGDLVFPPSLVTIVLDELRSDGARSRTKGPLATLTERELAVLALMAEGKTNATIAGALHLSSRTVEAHVTSIFTKLGLDPTMGGERRVLAVVAYLQAAKR